MEQFKSSHEAGSKGWGKRGKELDENQAYDILENSGVQQ